MKLPIKATIQGNRPTAVVICESERQVLAVVSLAIARGATVTLEAIQ